MGPTRALACYHARVCEIVVKWAISFGSFCVVLLKGKALRSLAYLYFI